MRDSYLKLGIPEMSKSSITDVKSKRIIIKWMLKKQNVRAWTVFN